MPSDYEYRTLVTRLSVAPDQRDLLEETIDEWRHGCQLATDLAWNKCHQPGDVQSLAYDSIREETELGSQHAVLATREASEAIIGCIEHIQAGRKTSKPTFTAPTVTYDARSMTLFDDGTVSLATVGSRIRCLLDLPDDEEGYQYQYLWTDEWELSESTLTIRDGAVFLHVGVRRPVDDNSTAVREHPTAEGGAVLGVDFGVDRIAVTSTARFFHGGELQHRIDEYERVRAGLEAAGTRSARRTLRESSGRERRYVTDLLHRIANGIVEDAIDHDCSVIAIEDLTDIQRSVGNPGWVHRWAFRRLREILEYKAPAAGIDVEPVEPRNTSRRCSECGMEADADYNAAKNVGLRYVRRGPQSPRGTSVSHCALKSGTVTPSGEFTPRPGRVRG